jgi:hypothetical protein
VAASVASSDASEEPFTAVDSTGLNSVRLAIRGYLDIRYVGPVPHYALLFEQDEECPPYPLTGPLGEKKLYTPSSRSQSARGSRKKFTTEEDSLFVKLKETKGLS